MINLIARWGLGVVDVAAQLGESRFDDFKRKIIPAPGFTTLAESEKKFWAEFKQCWSPNGLFLYNRPEQGEPLDFGDTALHHGLAVATIAWKNHAEPTDETRQMLIDSVKAMAQLFKLGRSGKQYAIRGVNDKGETREDISNDSGTGLFFGLFEAVRSKVPEAEAWAQDLLSILALELCEGDYCLVDSDGKPTTYGRLINGALTAPPLAALCIAILKAAAIYGKASYKPLFSQHFERVNKKYGALIDLSDFKFLWFTKSHEAHRAAMNLYALAELFSVTRDGEGCNRAVRGLDRLRKLEAKSANWWILSLAAARTPARLVKNGELELAINRLSEIDPATRPLRVEKRNSLDQAFWKANGMRFFNDPPEWMPGFIAGKRKLRASQPLPPWMMGNQDYMPQRDLLSVDDNAGETSQHHRYSGHDFLAPYWLLRRYGLVDAAR